jgi:hypothetical protein
LLHAAPIKIDPDVWKAQFPATYGSAVIPPLRGNITIAAGELQHLQLPADLGLYHASGISPCL